MSMSNQQIMEIAGRLNKAGFRIPAGLDSMRRSRYVKCFVQGMVMADRGVKFFKTKQDLSIKEKNAMRLGHSWMMDMLMVRDTLHEEAMDAVKIAQEKSNEMRQGEAK